jgi:2'-5' RNA ligase
VELLLIRTFLAIDLDDTETIQKIEEFLQRLKQNQPKLKAVKPENLHLTVKFLDNIPEALAPQIYKIIDEDINKSIFQGQTYTFKLKGVGQFNKYSVIWVKLIGDVEMLQKIKTKTEDLLYDNLNIIRDRRSVFKPHLTIGRLKKERINYKTFDALKNLIHENRLLEFGSFKINQIKLKKSELTPAGPIYSDLVF